MKARKILDGKNKNRILISDDLFNWKLAATATDPTVHYISGTDHSNSIEIDILKEKWIHPHLLKVFKEEVKKLLVNSKK